MGGWLKMPKCIDCENYLGEMKTDNLQNNCIKRNIAIHPEDDAYNCLEFQPKSNPKIRQFDAGGLCPVRHKDYMNLSDAYDKHSRKLMDAKGEEYAIENDFLAMENRLAGMRGDTPENVSLVMAGKHITSLGIILDKNKTTDINLEKWDERIRDAINLLKITSAFIHAKQNDFSLHLGKSEKKCETS